MEASSSLPHAATQPPRLTAEAFEAAEGLLGERAHELFVQVLEQFTERLVAEVRASIGPAETLAADDLADLSNRAGCTRARGGRPGVLREAFERAAEEYGLSEDELPIEPLVGLTMTFAQGYALERLEGIDEGHAELLDWIDRWLESLEERKRRAA
jgi:hypothetical protein